MLYQQRALPPPVADQTDQFVMSDSSVDRLGDVVAQDGWQLENFKQHPIALFNHNKDLVIGMWRDVGVRAGKLTGRLQLAEEGTSPFIDTVRKLHKQGILRAVSVGFQVREKRPLHERASKDFGPFRYTKAELLECSLVSVPANPAAMAVTKDLPQLMVRELFRESASEQVARSQLIHGVSANDNAQMERTTMSTLSQKIQAATQRHLVLRDSLNDLLTKDDMNDEEQRQYDALPGQIETALAEIEKHKRAERALVGNTANDNSPFTQVASNVLALSGEIIAPGAERQMPVPPKDGSIGSPPLSLPKRKVEQGDHVLRALSAWAKATAAHEPDLSKALRDMYGNDEAASRLTNVVLRAAVNPAMTTVATWAAELVQTEHASFLDRLIPEFIYPQIAAMGQRYTFSQAGIIKIPVRAATPALAGNWVGEGAPKPVRRAAFTMAQLTPSKLAVISTFTEEMALYSIPTIEAIIRKAMSDDTGIALDSYLIDAAAASSVRPAGLLNGVTPIAASALTPLAAAMVADIKALIAALQASGGGKRVAILVNPAQRLSLAFAQTTTGDFLFTDLGQAGSKFNVTFISSLTVPVGRVIAVDCDAFATAAGDVPRFAVSTDATLHEEDTSPLAIGTAGAPATIAAPTRSLFQTDAVAIRMSLYVTWAMVRAGMVQTIAAVSW